MKKEISNYILSLGLIPKYQGKYKTFHISLPKIHTNSTMAALIHIQEGFEMVYNKYYDSGFHISKNLI